MYHGGPPHTAPRSALAPSLGPKTDRLIAEPMRFQTQYDLENGRLTGGPELPKQLTRLGWDETAADNIWAFGRDSRCGPNILVDDTLPPKLCLVI
jgi:hypothetical protein